MTYYRGDQRRPTPPALTPGTWLTPEPDIAAWYGEAYRYDLPDDLRILDLRPLGIGDGEDVAQVDALRATLDDAGIDTTGLRLHYAEIFLVVQQPAFVTAAQLAGYDAVAVMQWHADLSSDPYEALLWVRA